ncbi:MAG: hypothetical protein PHW95_04365 [Patescibacteria group bacterium]|nr:hypothetical protein [Patescibacteria group bacterium]
MRRLILLVMVVAVGYWLLHSYPKRAEYETIVAAQSVAADSVVDTRDVFRESIHVVMFYAKSGAALIFVLVLVVFLTIRTDFSDDLMASSWERMVEAISQLQLEKLARPISERLARQTDGAPAYKKMLAKWREELGLPKADDDDKAE